MDPHEKYKVFDNLLEGVQVIDKDGCYLYLNHAAALQGKRARDELQGRYMTVEYPGIEHTEVFKKIQQCCIEQLPGELINEFTYPDDSAGFFKLRLQPVEEGALIMSYDISDLKRAEVTALRANTRLRQLLDERTDETTQVKNDMLRARHQLNERIKELSVIYQLHTILQDDTQSVEDVFTRIVNMLPSGWQYPEFCAARIEFNGKAYCTERYTAAAYSQVATMALQDGRKGLIEVVYTEETGQESEGPFLQEERDLINTLAEIIQVYFNKKSNQDSLAGSEARFRGAFENAAIGMALVSLQGAWLMVNKSLCDMTGYSQQELMQLTFQQITHPDDLANDLAFLNETLAGKRDYYRIEKRYFHKEGKTIWINLNVSLIKDSSGNPLYFVSQIEDITVKGESEIKFRSLVEQSQVGVYILRDGRFAYVNPRIVAESGFTEQELTGQPVSMFVFEEDVPLIMQHINTRLSGAMKEIRYEARARNKNGDLMWLEMFGTTTVYEGGMAIIGTMVNITDKKTVYNDLVKSEANLRSIFGNTQVGYLLLDEKYRVVSYNDYFVKTYARVSGISLRVGVSAIDLTLPEKKENLSKLLEQVKATAGSVEYETTFGRGTRASHYNVTVSPIADDGRIIGFCLGAFDVTQKKNMEIERQKMLAALINRNNNLQEFAQIVSHNMRGPLSTILGLINMVRNEQPGQDLGFILDGIGETAEKLDDVVKEMNYILHAHSESIDRKERVPLQAVMDEVKNSFASSISVTEAVIACDFSRVPEIVTIRSFMHNILYNLLSNSLKYRRKGVAPHIEVLAEKTIEGVLLTFSDNGIGIDMEKHGSKVFRLNKRFQNMDDGEGLGLFTVKAQIDVLDGTIEVNSRPGHGTTFRIKLPL